MPTFRYKGLDAKGSKASGTITASSRESAVIELRSKCSRVDSLRAIPELATLDLFTPFRKINSKNLAITCKQFSIILKSGLPIIQAVELAAEQCPDKSLSKILKQVAEDITGGWSLANSFNKRGSRTLPVTFRETVRAGEESGDLLAAFDRMSGYFDRMTKTHQNMMSALSYPACVIVVAVIVVGIIMNYAVPAFIGMFSTLGNDLPLPTRVLIFTSNFTRKWTLVIIVAAALGLLILKLYADTDRGAIRLARLQLRLPVIGDVVVSSNASQFSHTLSTLLEAGMQILPAIESSGRVMSNACMAQEVLKVMSGVESGHSLGECLSKSKELPKMLVQMTAVGETSGALESTLRVLAEYYDNETDVKVKHALALLEPAIIVVLSIFVVFILMAVYLPLFGMYNGMT